MLQIYVWSFIWVVILKWVFPSLSCYIPDSSSPVRFWIFWNGRRVSSPHKLRLSWGMGWFCCGRRKDPFYFVCFKNISGCLVGWLNCSPTALVLIVWNLFVIFKVITCFLKAFINHSNATRTSGWVWKPMFNLEARHILLIVPVTGRNLHR